MHMNNENGINPNKMPLGCCTLGKGALFRAKRGSESVTAKTPLKTVLR